MDRSRFSENTHDTLKKKINLVLFLNFNGYSFDRK